jgi:hypothetical protein
MDAILRFKLPQNREEFELALQGWQFRGVCDDMDRLLRNKLKHGDISKELHAELTEIREHLHASLTSYGVHL